ncbi:MAG: DNA repair protein RecN [Agromyces sp.]
MIEELHIRNLGVIAEAHLPLGPGFTAVTGETGAGKTMVVTALGLVLGERADAGAVRSGADQAEVDARVLVREPSSGGIAELVDEVGGRIDDGELLLGRTVSSEGRSRASIGGRAAPVGALNDLAEHLVAVHGQSEQIRLRSATAQREALDRYAGPTLLAVQSKYRDSYLHARALEAQLVDLSDNRDAREREAEQLRADLEEITSLNPLPGEDEELALRVERLANTEALRLAAATAHDALSSESLDGADVLALLETARRTLERAADPELDPLAVQLNELSFAARDIAASLAGFVANLDEAGPAELDALNERRAALTALIRKFATPDGGLVAVLDYAERASERLLALDTSDEAVEALRAELGAERDRVRMLASELSAARHAAATELSAAVTSELRALALPDAQLVVEVSSVPLGGPDEPLPSALTETGADTVTLLLAPHPGSEPRPIAKTASGGELSRVMLALEVVISATDPVPTFVFDEVDAGVGGAAAIEIGRRLAKLSKHSQVIVVTHLAQVAAFADNHLRVHKSSDGFVTASSVERLTGAAREAEMARLLSGLAESDSGLAHARELLALAE